MSVRAYCCFLLLSLVACGPQHLGEGALGETAIAARVAAGHLHRHMTQSPRTLDPSLNEDVAAYAIADDLFEGLVRLDAAGNVIPAVASSWRVSADGLQWRFFLRPEARWSNDEPVTAADFVYAWRRVVDPNTASVAAQQLLPIAGAAEVISGKASPASLAVMAVDAHTLDVRLAAPTPYFLYLLTNCWLMPLHAATVQRHGNAWTQPQHMVGNGAFVLRTRVINGPVELVRNPRFRDASAVRLQAVTYHPVPDTASATSRFLAGDLDITDRFQVDDLGWLRADLGNQVRLEPYFGTFMMAMDVSRPPFDDLRLRRALVMALDRELLAAKVLKGLFLPAYGIVPPLPGYSAVMPDWRRLDSSARQREAQRLYAAAGFSAAQPLRVELWYPTADADTRRVLQAMVAMWRMNLGADVQLSNEEWRVHQQNRRIHKHRLFFYPWIGDYPDPLTFLALPLPESGQNYMRYANPRFAEIIGLARQQLDPVARNASYGAAERILNADAVVIPVYYYQSRHLLRRHVQGWQSNPMDRHASRDLHLALIGAANQSDGP
jgi:oligopeptide transport system substrate-binding protein